MFATREPNFKRRLAGHVGGLVGATAMLLTVYPSIAAAAPAVDKLTLASVCTLPDGDAVMKVGNSNAVDIVFTWDIANTKLSGKAVAVPGENYFLVSPSIAGNTRVFVDGKQHAAKKQNPDVCVGHVQVSKQWLDAKGAPIASPSVPKGWALTLRSDLETVTCTWNKGAGAVKCSSKVDAEDKGNFANVGTSLEVPVGGKYTIDETPTPGFDPTGLGGFVVESPEDLAKFFGGGDIVAALVINSAQSSVEETTTTTTEADEETTTTTESPTTTLAPAEETTTTTSSVGESTTTLAPAQETTTTTESPSTTLAPAEETTTTTEVDEETTTTEVDEETTTTEVDKETTTTEVDEESTTTTESPSTTLAAAEETTTTTPSVEETTTVAPPTSGPAGERGLALDPAAGEPQPDPATQVLAGTDGPDVLPVTGVPLLPITLFGVGLVAIGTCIALAARRRLEV